MATQRYVALLGGINVGGHRVKMNTLRELFEALGFTNVATFIASGNVSFDAAATDVPVLQARIAQHLNRSLGYKVPTFLRSWQELTAITHYQPFPNHEPHPAAHTLSILFTTDRVPDDLRHIFFALRTPMDAFHVHGRCVGTIPSASWFPPQNSSRWRKKRA